jgi:hypothetical protein
LDFGEERGERILNSVEIPPYLGRAKGDLTWELFTGRVPVFLTPFLLSLQDLAESKKN